MFTPESQFSRYRALVSHLAGSAWETAEAASPPEPTPNTLTLALPAARVLVVGERRTEAVRPVLASLEALTSGGTRLVTLTGQTRPVYFPLAAHLLLRALAQQREVLGAPQWAEAQAHVAALAERLTPGPPTRDMVALVLWQALCQLESSPLRQNQAQAISSAQQAAQQVDAVLAASRAGGPLHEQRTDDQLDHWTYRELSGLHALANLALHAQREDWWAAVHRIVNFHMEHTQPDYTTYEPWGVHAFLHQPPTMVFADQQLHDTQTNLHVGGPSVALLPALLLADATQAMNEPGFTSTREKEA